MRGFDFPVLEHFHQHDLWKSNSFPLGFHRNVSVFESFALMEALGK